MQFSVKQVKKVRGSDPDPDRLAFRVPPDFHSPPLPYFGTDQKKRIREKPKQKVATESEDEYLTAREIAGLPGLPNSERGVRMKAEREGWKAMQAKCKGGLMRKYHISNLPEQVQVELVCQTLPIPKPQPREFHRVDGKMRDDAMARTALVRHYAIAIGNAEFGRKDQARENFCLAYNSGQLFPELYAQLGTISWQTLERWKVALREKRNPLNLADKRGRTRKGVTKITTAEKNLVKGCALFPNAPTIANAIRVAMELMKARGITPSASPQTYRRWLEKWRTENRHLWTLFRQGEKALNDKVLPYVIRDYSKIGVGDVLVADGHTLNFDILNPWTGKEKRMTMILWEDMRSGYPCGWEIMPSENTMAIASAFRRAILHLGKIPRFVYLDNGRAFRSQFFNGTDLSQTELPGVFQRLGCEVIFAQPYHGQSKTIERFFGTFKELEQWVPTYRGGSIEEKPAYLARNEKFAKKLHDKIMQGRCITLEMAHRAIAAYFDMYANRPSHGDRLKGHTPGEIFHAGKGPGVDPDELRFLMMASEEKKISGNGISFRGEWYYDPALYGRDHKVTIRYDLQDPTYLVVYHPDDIENPLCVANRIDEVHPVARMGNEEDRRALENQLAMKEGLKRLTIESSKDVLEHLVMPEYERKMELDSLNPNQLPAPAGKKKAEVIRITKADMDKAQQQADETLREMHAEAAQTGIPDFDIPAMEDAIDIFSDLSMPEQYKIALFYYTIDDTDIPPSWMARMSYYEKTQDYKLRQEEWEAYQRDVLTMKYEKQA